MVTKYHFWVTQKLLIWSSDTIFVIRLYYTHPSEWLFQLTYAYSTIRDWSFFILHSWCFLFNLELRQKIQFHLFFYFSIKSSRYSVKKRRSLFPIKFQSKKNTSCTSYLKFPYSSTKRNQFKFPCSSTKMNQFVNTKTNKLMLLTIRRMSHIFNQNGHDISFLFPMFLL